MNLHSYKKRRERQLTECKQYRIQCSNCRQPQFGCYCNYIQKFDPKIKFIILIHPIEVKRRIATGRMAHLCLENSDLIIGQNFTQNKYINEILKNKIYQPFVLYPGIKSLNLSFSSPEVKSATFSLAKIPLLFVIDGTWATARKMVRQSENLKPLQKICFTPTSPSQFKVRKQPKVDCYSTIEAIHHCIDLLGTQVEFDFTNRQHDNLIAVFNKMVERQLQFVRDAFDNPRTTSYRRPKHRVA